MIFVFLKLTRKFQWQIVGWRYLYSRTNSQLLCHCVHFVPCSLFISMIKCIRISSPRVFVLVSRSAGSCSSSVCRLLDDGRDKTPPCWCSAETAVIGDPNNDDTAAAVAMTGRTTATGYRCPPRGSLSQHRGRETAGGGGGRPMRSRPPTTAAQSNVQRPPSRIVSSRCVSAGDWCCDNGDVDDDEGEQEEDDDDDYEDYYEYDDHVRDDNNRVRVVVMNNGSGLITGGGGIGSAVAVDGALQQQGRGTDAKPPAVAVQLQTAAAERTYASTEAQTDETACSSAYREQRRRERRERRQQQRRVHPPPPPPPALSTSTLLPPSPPHTGTGLPVSIDPDRLPDLLLNSHLPPPLYTTVGGSGVCDLSMQATRVTNLQASLLPAPYPHHHQPAGAPVGSPPGANSPGGFRLPFGIIPARRRRLVFTAVYTLSLFILR